MRRQGGPQRKEDLTRTPPSLIGPSPEMLLSLDRLLGNRSMSGVAVTGAGLGPERATPGGMPFSPRLSGTI